MEEIVIRPVIRPLLLILVLFGVSTIILSLIIAPFVPVPHLIFIAEGGLLIILLLYASKLTYYRQSTEYIITDRDVVKRTGIFAKDRKIVPLNRITNMTIDRSLIGAVLGLANIGIETASAKIGYEIVLENISSSEAERLVDEIRKRMEVKKSKR